jgi:hypothetical protein
MASFRILNQAPQYLLANGDVNAGGKLYTYETDLTTPKSTWAEEALTTLNSNPVVMDAAGRTLTDVWGDGEYGVVMTDADDVVIWTRNNVQAGGDPAQAIPALVTDRFLFNDGVDLIWSEVLQVPDPTGLSNYYLASDGTGVPVWTQFPEPEPPAASDITVSGVNADFAGTGGNFRIVTGAATGTNAGGRTQSISVTFAAAFSAAPVVFPVLTNSGNLSTFGNQPSPKITAVSTTGFTVLWTMGELDDSQAGYDFNAAVSMSWVAMGNYT